MSFEKFHATLGLLLMPGVTSVDCYGITESAETIWALLECDRGHEALGQRFGKKVGAVPWDAFERQLRTMRRIGAGAVTLQDERYPAYLSDISEPPPILFYQGSLAALNERGVAIVGTRKPTLCGRNLAHTLGRDLSAAGITVVSGLARGIDTAAHEGCLAGASGTVAVVGTGLDVPYPPENHELMMRIANNGCVVSEQLMGTTPQRFVFPRRNRLISALARAVVVVEAGARSGALITARWALEQGREVGVVPGVPGDFRSRGVNQLLRHGAFVVESAADVLEAVPLLDAAGPAPPAPLERPSVGGAADRLLELMGGTPADPDHLAQALGLSVVAVQNLLLELEIEGVVTRDALGRYRDAR